MGEKSYTVSRVARIARVTVRTLRHYDEIGLLVPPRRTPAGYRLYSYDDLQRLQQILLFRQLDFSLEAIQRLLDDPAHDRRAALRAQRELLREKVRRTEAVIQAVDATLEAMDGGKQMDETRMFDGFDNGPYLAEMYVSDPRFRQHYEKRREGLAEFVAGAIRANAARAE